MYFNEELNKDIQKLKELRKTGNTNEFGRLRKELMEKYNLSKASIYRHLENEAPGVMLTKPKNLDGEKIESDKTPARHKARSYEEIYKRFTSIEIHKEELKKETPEIGDALFGFFKKLFIAGFENVSSNSFNASSGIKMSVMQEDFTLQQADIDDICLIFANAYNRANEQKLKMPSNDYLRLKVRTLLEEWLRRPSHSASWLSFHDIDRISRMYKRIEEEQITRVMNFNVIQVICRELKPGITESEIFGLLKKFLPNVSTNCS